eukprot:CAMPEP_0175700956 /NCGR_PEP_ID=MMETSP0097-20121207/35244_1 /TAXON_ID=311494 /ORGANISM="Alexandrium monilatum, Strain CCMP3105" /LENGTH=155 /DNA_ID=CAMNT_0017008181 /DNA_START=291 /DNA_END=760 /DNA_ORIENTATION=-
MGHASGSMSCQIGTQPQQEDQRKGGNRYAQRHLALPIAVLSAKAENDPIMHQCRRAEDEDGPPMQRRHLRDRAHQKQPEAHLEDDQRRQHAPVVPDVLHVQPQVIEGKKNTAAMAPVACVLAMKSDTLAPVLQHLGQCGHLWAQPIVESRGSAQT